MIRWASASAIVFALGVWASACTVGKGEGWVRGNLSVSGCGTQDLSHYDMDPDFFGANAVNSQMIMRVQPGGDFQEYADSLTIAVQDIEYVNQQIEASTSNPKSFDIKVELERPPGSLPSVPAPLVRMTLSLRHTCGSGTYNPAGDDPEVLIHATSGTITFTSIVHGDLSSRDTNSKRIEGSFTDVIFEDPRQVASDGTPPKTSTVSAYFKFFYQRGGPAQPFP